MARTTVAERNTAPKKPTPEVEAPKALDPDAEPQPKKKPFKPWRPPKVPRAKLGGLMVREEAAEIVCRLGEDAGRNGVHENVLNAHLRQKGLNDTIEAYEELVHAGFVENARDAGNNGNVNVRLWALTPAGTSVLQQAQAWRQKRASEEDKRARSLMQRGQSEK